MKRFRIWGLLSLGALLSGLFGVFTAQAAPPAPANFTVAAGQTATVQVNVFCLDFGKDFPAGQNVQPGSMAEAKLMSALSYAVDKGYDQSNPRQTQLALWYLRDNTYHTNAGENSTIAQEIVGKAGSGTAPAATGTGTVVSLSDAVKNNQVTVTATGVKALTQGEYYGTATLAVKNNGTTDLNLTLAPGTTFTAQGANFQLMIGYPTGSQGNAPAAQATTAAATTAATTTVAATTAAVATTTAATTAPATTVATTTVAATTAPATTVATTVAATTAAPTTVATTTAAPTTVASASLPSAGEGGAASGGQGGTLLVALLVMSLIAFTAGTGLVAIKGRK